MKRYFFEVYHANRRDDIDVIAESLALAYTHAFAVCDSMGFPQDDLRYSGHSENVEV